MFKKNQRISRVAFTEVALHGREYHSSYFTLRTILDPKLTRFHISFVISKKTASMAVERNSLRKRGYAIVRSLLNFKVSRPFIGVFFVKKKAIKLSTRLYRREIEILLKRARIL